MNEVVAQVFIYIYIYIYIYLHRFLLQRYFSNVTKSNWFCCCYYYCIIAYANHQKLSSELLNY